MLFDSTSGRHLLQENSTERTATVEEKSKPSTAEAIASALAAAVFEVGDNKESSDSEEDSNSFSFSPEVKKNASGLVSVSHSAQVGEETHEHTSPTSPPEVENHRDENEEEALGREPSDFKLKSAKRRSWRKDDIISTPVHKVCESSKAVSIEMLLTLLQDPDRGAERAMVTKDVRLRKGIFCCM